MAEAVNKRAKHVAKHVMQITSTEWGMTRVLLDGQELENVTDLHYYVHRGEVRVELTFQHLEIITEAEVFREESKVIRTETTAYYGVGGDDR